MKGNISQVTRAYFYLQHGSFLSRGESIRLIEQLLCASPVLPALRRWDQMCTGNQLLRETLYTRECQLRSFKGKREVAEGGREELPRGGVWAGAGHEHSWLTETGASEVREAVGATGSRGDLRGTFKVNAGKSRERVGW